MKKNKTKLKLIFFLISIFILLFAFSFSCFNIKNNLKSETQNQNNNFIKTHSNSKSTDENEPNENSKITNTTACVSVGEIWNNTTKQFKKTELFDLIKKASNSTIKVNDISAIKNRVIKSITMKSYNSNMDILVTLGGFQWTVTYLSQDNNGNPILTLWLANSTQLSGKTFYASSSSTGAPFKTTFNSGATSKWNSGFSPNNNPGSAYPDGMYGTSYIRAVTLNNGGWYSTATGGSSGITFTKKTDSVFSEFTITTSNNTAIADYLVTPANVDWQKNLSYKDQRVDPSWLYNMANEGWGKDSNNANYYGGAFNFSNKDKYSTWKDDLIWLPSMTETGFITGSSNGKGIGLWYTSPNQRSNPSNYSWLRSCYYIYADGAYAHIPSGENVYDSGRLVNNYYGVRPALHLNLAKAVVSATDVWNSTKVDSEVLNLVLKYLAGTNTATTNASLLSSLSSTIGSGAIKSSTIKTNANKVTDKAFINASSELVIKFGGLNWFATYLTKNNSGQVILTMWLADSGQLYNKGKTGTDGSVKYNVYGSASWNSGSPPYSDGTSAISNNYGNSNIRTSYFSSTTNPASVFCNYLKTSTNKTAIGDFIISPKDLNMQDSLYLQKNQSAKTTLGFRYNLPNESFSALINYSAPYKNLSLSTSTTNYIAWQNDKLWLPSLSEVGLGSNNTISTNSTTSNNLRISGLWGLSTVQRSNTNKTATWLRSGHITDKNLAYTISFDGLDYGYATLNTQNAIRPALHLNLTLASQYAS